MRRRRLPEPFVIFVDECLGRDVVPTALRAALEEGEDLILVGDARPRSRTEVSSTPDTAATVAAQPLEI